MKLSQKLFVSILIVTMIASLTFNPSPTQQAKGADGTTGIVQFGFSEYMPGNSYIIILKSLNVGADYQLNFTAGCATNIAITTGATETELSKRVTLAAPTSGSECVITLLMTAAQTSLDSVRLQATELTDVINQDEIIDNLMIVLVIVVVVSLVLGIYRKMT